MVDFQDGRYRVVWLEEGVVPLKDIDPLDLRGLSLIRSEATQAWRKYLL
jgi:hypothetical protein